jgi:hypothetical protein
VEFTHRVGAVEIGEPLPRSVPFDFDAAELFPLHYLSWREEYGPSDVGMTFVAPADVIDAADQAIASPTAGYYLETGPANFSTPTTLPTSNC